STDFEISYPPARSRLDTKKEGNLGAGWLPNKYELTGQQWIQADLDEVMFITGVITQGREHYWFTYTFLYGETEENLKEYGQILEVNNDYNTKVIKPIEPPV
ncbi:unnamed protein product, partial [Owenia fusiformis]